jgi:hypothetical protein
MDFTPNRMRELGGPEKAHPPKQGLVLIKSVQVSPVGATNWGVAKLAIDAQEARFKDYRRVLFSFTAFGNSQGSAASLGMSPRRNGTNHNVMRSYQVTGQTAASTSVYVNSNTAGGSLITANAQFMHPNFARTLEVWMDQWGYDTYLAMGANTTLPTAGMHNSTATYWPEAAKGPSYGPQDYPGLELYTDGGQITTARSSAIIVPAAPIICDIYGWAIEK